MRAYVPACARAYVCMRVRVIVCECERVQRRGRREKGARKQGRVGEEYQCITYATSLFVTDVSVSHRSNIWGRRWKSRTYKDANCQKAKNTGYGKEGP